MILPGFTHRPGLHCGSTALVNALAARGVVLSEPLAFGLGAGLGFHAIHAPGLSPSQQLLGRAIHLERTACELLGAPAVERTAPTAEAALEGVEAALARGVAPILSTDLALLPYWRSRTPFGGHRVVLAGLERGHDLALLSDTGHLGLQGVPLRALDAARASLAPPLGLPGRPWLEIDAPPAPRPLPLVIREALRRQARDLLLDVEGVAGVSALERFAAELPSWPARAAGEADRAWTFRFAHQVIDLRGTGGGLFRGLYARFLREAEELVPGLAALGLAPRMEAISGAWSRLAAGLRAVGEEAGAEVPEALAAEARALAAAERRFFEDVAARVP
ncbi:MAG: DUF4872 domain-containing protein [Anaeromyxobacter sp.]